MRYNIDQKVWTIGLVLVRKHDNKPVFPLGFLRPYPDQFSITNMFFNELTVVEHHKVPGEWSDEKQYDGFILKDDQDRVWHNQYPRASYGQLSDEADDLFTSPLFAKILEDSRDTCDDRSRIWDRACVNFIDKYKVTINQYSLTRFMDELTGGILHDDGLTKTEHHEVWPKLVEIQNRVLESFNKATGKKLESYIKQMGDLDQSEGCAKKVIRFRQWRVID